MDSESFLSLKSWVLGSWLLTLVGFHWLLRTLLPERPLVIQQAAFAALLLGTALLNFLISLSPGLQKLIISPKRLHLFKPGTFFFVGFLLLMFGFVMSIDAFLLLNGVCLPKRSRVC
jgi:hypothetical protein